MTDSTSRPAERRSRWQFSVRTIFLLMAAVAALAAVYRVAPQLDAFGLSVTPAVLCVHHGVRQWRKNRVVSRPAAVAVLPSFGMLYVASIGPAIVLANHHPVCERILEPVYTPLIWLHANTFFHDPLDWYASFWFDLT